LRVFSFLDADLYTITRILLKSIFFISDINKSQFEEIFFMYTSIFSFLM
jgi:hypothetical protein